MSVRESGIKSAPIRKSDPDAGTEKGMQDSDWEKNLIGVRWKFRLALHLFAPWPGGLSHGSNRERACTTTSVSSGLDRANMHAVDPLKI